MKVIAKTKAVSLADREAQGMDSRFDPQFQLTVGKEYLVVSVASLPDSVTYGKVVLYRIVDDANRLIPAPACLFDISDAQVSDQWVASYKGLALSLEPEEFVRYPSLSEDIFDQDPLALESFHKIFARIAGTTK